MSEGDVSQIRDEDVLRRMWQQTEDFSRKKEIRAHMYRLREERLRNLYSPEPSADGKGVEPARTHVHSFADQSFQGMKSKEVRDAASPPKEFHYRGQDLKELSNAGWNVQSENKTTDDGHTHVRNVRADIEGRYDVEGGTGQFAAVDKHRQAVTEYQDENTSLKRNESSTNTAAHEQVVRKTDDGTQMSSTTSSSTASSKFQQVSTSNVPYVDDYDRDTNQEYTKVTKTNDYEQNLRSNLHQGELVSRKVDYPDDNTKVIVETRCLPDGTRVTSTRREFRAPVQTKSEQHSSRSESKSSYTTQQRSDVKSSKIIRETDSRNDIVDSQRHADDYDFKRNFVDSTNQTDDYSHTQRTNILNKRSDKTNVRESTAHETVDSRSDVDSRINKDFTTQKDNYSDTAQRTNRYESKVIETDQRNVITSDNKRNQIDYSINKDDCTTQRTNRYETKTDQTDHREIINDNHDIHRDVKEIHHVRDNEERVHNITRDKKEEVVERKTSSEQYQTTYQTDFSQKKISNDWSPTQQAWASSLRSDTPTSTRPTTRASSPGGRTFQSSTSSLRSSVSPDKTRKPPSRGGSPSKIDRSSPARSTDRYSSSHSNYSVTETTTNRYTSPDRKPPSAPKLSSSPDRKPDGYRQRPSASPEKRPQDQRNASPEIIRPGYKPTDDYSKHSPRSSLSPDRKPGYLPSDGKSSPDSSVPHTTSPYRSTISPEKKIPEDSSPKRTSVSPDKKPGYQKPTEGHPSPTSKFPRNTSPSRPHSNDSRPRTSPDQKPGYLPSPTRANPEKPGNTYVKESPIRSSMSPDRKPGYMRPTATITDNTTKYTSPDRRSPAKHMPSQSPDRKTFNKTTNIKEDHYKFIDEETKMYTRTDREDINITKRTSPSPDRFLGPREKSPSPFKTSEDTLDHCRRESPSIRPSIRKDSRSPSPPKGPVTFTQDQVDKSEKYESTVSEVTTKFNQNTDNTKQYRTPKHEGSRISDSPREPSPSKYGTYDKKRRSEETETTTFTNDTKDVKYDLLTHPEKSTKTAPDTPVSSSKRSPRDTVSPTITPSAPRQPSPTKYGTYEKKFTKETEELTTLTKDTKDVKYDSSTSREKLPKTVSDVPASPTKKSPRDSVSPAKSPSAPTKYGTYEKKHTEETEEITITKDSSDIKYDSLTRREKTSPRKVPDIPASPTKKSPRDSTSPVKSPTKDAKYKHTTDFIYTEKTTEEVNKRTTTKDRPRQLVTPSTSPTRIPKTVETAPSTGQSSPTTSVSGFVYFGSPRSEKTIVTDLDDVEYYTETDNTDATTTTYKRPETLNLERDSPSRSKIPCRSPSPEKRVSPKDSLPRKSSLKKPSTDFPQVSPTEKPPSSFRVSPTEDTKEFPEHKIVKKDRPDKPIDSPAKIKPPFERRETYEDRCRKILGMMQDDTTTVAKETYVQEPASNLSTPSVSPCRSPEPKEQSPARGYVKDTNIVTDFITREKVDTIKKCATQREDVTSTDKNSKTPSRDNSPTKLQDIISHKPISKYDETTVENVVDTSKTFTQSPDREVGYQKSKDQLKHKPTDLSYPRTSPQRSFSPEKKAAEVHPKGIATKPGFQKPTENRPSPTFEQPRSVQSKPTETRTGMRPDKHPSSTTSSPDMEPADKYPKESIPTRSLVSPSGTPGYMRPTAAKTTRYEETTTSEDIQEDVSKTTHVSSDRETGYQITTDSRPNPTHEFPRTTSPTAPKNAPKRPSVSPERKPGYQHPSAPTKSTLEKKPVDKTPSRASLSPDRKPGYMKPTATSTTKYATETKTEDSQDETTLKMVETKHPASKLPRSQQPTSDSPSKKPEEPKHSRSPSPAKKTTKVTEITDFIQSEREQEILERVQQSLRKLSPSRDQRSPSRERSPGKTISLHDLDVTTETVICGKTISEDDVEITENLTSKTDVKRLVKHSDDKSKQQKLSSKPPSRNVSPTKKPTTPAPKLESPTKSRSISPKKPVSPTERSQSPQVPRASGIKPREHIPSNLSRRPTPGNTSPAKIEKVATEVKKTTSSVKQNSFGKTTTTKTATTHTPKVVSPTNKTESEQKRAPTPKGINKENVSPKKEDIKVTRTASDISIKMKKASPQRMKSKPEIQVSDMSTTRTTKTTTTTGTTTAKKSTIKEPQPKLAPKPKSATALNTHMDDDDIIIDVELAKSSRENSPDRICPTPINFNEDVGTPRFPDEVSEPDDEFSRRTHHTIHETESIVDDIVEICEDDELFVKRTGVDETDECLLSVTDKVSKFTNKIDTVTKPKDSTVLFRDTERRVHSDYDENLKSDECLLSVSEKVNKFAKGPRDTKDSRSPSRKIVDEYDTGTTYQDDYTKLSVNDKAHLFVETAESTKVTKTKPVQKVERPDLTEVDESLRSDDCLLSVSDKVNKFVKTAEQFLVENQETEEKDKKVKEQYEKIMRNIVQDDDETQEKVDEDIDIIDRKTLEGKRPSFTKETASSHTKVKDYASPNLKPTERTPTVKITTLRSSEAVKKAKALFENIASTTQKTKETKVTKLTDIGVIKKSPKTDSTIVHHPSLEDGFSVPDLDSEVDAPTPTTKDRPTNGTPTRPHQPGRFDNKPQSSPTHLTTQSPEVPRSKSPVRTSVETTITTKTVLSRYPAANAESPKRSRPETEKHERQVPRHQGTHPTETKPARYEPEIEHQEKVPSYQRPTKTSLNKEETKTVEETEVSSRRGSGKFGVELRRTSVERSTVSSERRRSSEHHQPCIEDIFDLDLLEQMLEKVVGYEQRRRIRAQIRVARKRTETTDLNSHTRTKQTTVIHKSPERRPQTKSPERRPKTTPQKTLSPERQPKSTPPKPAAEPTKPLLNGHAKEPSNLTEKRQRPQSPEKPRVAPKTKSPVRHPSPEKKTRPVSPSKTPAKPKPNKFNEYASAYMKKVGLNEADKLKTDVKPKNTDTEDHRTQKSKIIEFEDNQFEHQTMETKTSHSKSFTERTSSKDFIEVKMNGKRSPSPEKKRSPDRHTQSPTERIYQRSPSPDFKRKTSKETIIKTVFESEPILSKDTKETIIKTVYEELPKKDTIKTLYEIEKKLTPKQTSEEKPSWVTNRNLKKTTSETRTFSNKKIDEKKYRTTVESPSRAVATVDAITSSYGPGPLDADGRPLFGIKALRNGASNYQVKGTVVRQEFHTRNGGEPEGTVSVTAYSTEPEDLEKLLQTQGEKPSRIHGLAAITTTKKFGGDTGTTLKEAHGKEERATLEQFTHSDRRVDSRVHHLEDRTQDSRSKRIHHLDDRTQSNRVHLEHSKTPDSMSKRHPESRTQDTKSSRVQHLEDRTQDLRSNRIRTEEKNQENMSERREEKGREEKVRRSEERRERAERREDRKTVRQSSVKSLTEKFIKSASDTSRTERSAYPKAGLILRTSNMKDSVSSDSSAHAGLGRTDSAHSLASVEDTTVVTTRTQGDGHHSITTTTTTSTGSRKQERSFLDSSTKVTGVQDILTRMKNADIVIQEGDSAEDTEARALLNKFLGATVLMAGMQSYVTEPAGRISIKQETVRSSGGRSTNTTSSVELDLDQCWDERVLRNLLEECTDYEQRRRLRARLRTLMAEQEACASAVTDALAAAGETPDTPEADAREEEEVTVTSSARRNSSEKTVSSSTTTKTSKVIESMTRPAPKPVSPFAKFRQLEKQNSTTSPNPASPRTPSSPGTPAQPYFKFTDPALQASALTIKERLLQWCRDKTRDYENVKLENFSTSWADGLAFCALLHHFLPDAFDYSLLTPDKRRHNFTLAFKIADEKAGIYPLLDVDDMVAMRKPDWKCVFTYVQSIHRRFKDHQ